MKLSVSIGIPVYNGEKFIKKSAESAVHLDEVAEVIIVDDGSTDNTYHICRELENKYTKIRLLQHPGGLNQGLPASRNLAVREAACEYVAFLDADDYYLPNRFEKTIEVFQDHPEADGVYEALGIKLYSDKAEELFSNTFRDFTTEEEYLTTIRENLTPSELFNRLLKKSSGALHCDTLTLKKSLFIKSGLFSEELRLHGDNEAFLRFAYYGKLYPGKITKPVAIRGVHENNRVTTKQDKYKRSLWYETVFRNFADKKLKREEARIIFKDYFFAHRFKLRNNSLLKYLSYLWISLYTFGRYPVKCSKIVAKAYLNKK